MSNRTYLCIKCRTSKRAEARYGLNSNFRCSNCQQDLWELEWRWRIPKKTDDKAWKELEEKVISESEEWLKRRTEIGQEKIEKIERLIIHFEKQKDSERKYKKLKSVKTEIETIKKKYT